MRNYGRFTTGIFRDEDFRALTAAEQGVYFLLGLQPEMTAAGTLSLTLRRWASMSAGMTRDELAEHLSVLADKGHIVVDFDTEELLIRKFIKWDGGIENSKRQPVVREAACAIESKRIRHAIALELVKLGHRDMASEVCRDALPDAQPGFDRGVVTEGESVPHPQSATQEGEPPGNAGPPSMFCSKHPNGTEKPCGPCGTAKLRYSAWVKQQTSRDVESRKARAAAIAACGECDATGIRLDPDTRQPLGRCDHSSTLRTVTA